MGNLLTSLLNSAHAMRAFDRQIAVIQNNVSNSSTPGYVRQTQTLAAMAFDLESAQTGGVEAAAVISSRSRYAEESVRREQSNYGDASQRAGDLVQVESLFDLAANYGVPGTISKFFQSFSQLSVNPNNEVARQTVIDGASDVADSFNQTAIGLTNAGISADRQIREVVDGINRLSREIRDLNAVRRGNPRSSEDAGLDAQMHSTLEQLAELADYSVMIEEDGTFSVYMGGQTPLVIGDHQFAVTADFSDPQTAILDSTGFDMSGQIRGGRLNALLEEKNKLVPDYMASLNHLAEQFAYQVNMKLGQGVDADGAPPTIDLFTLDPLVGASMSIRVNNIGPRQIAAALPDAPGGNGNALDLASMVNDKLVDGFTFTEYFGNLAGRVGRDVATAREQSNTHESLLSQAHVLRDEVSAVSLDEEAAHLIQVQRVYQAAGKVLSVLNEMTDTLMSIVR